MNKFIEFLKETKAEMTHVKWPTRLQTVSSTVAVIIVSVFIAYYLGFFDFVFKTGLESVLTR